MDYVDSLMEMVIEEDSIEEYKSNREILQEFHYSKEELQDPEILKKVLEKTKQGDKSYNKYILKISFCLSTSLSIVTSILTKKVKVGLALYIPFILGSLFLIDAFLKKAFYTTQNLDKNINDLKNKVIKLKEKSEKLSDSESKQIVDNCNKVLDKIKKYEANKQYKINKKIKNMEEHKRQDQYNKDNYINKPFYDDNFNGAFYNILLNLKEKGISASKVVEGLTKNYESLGKQNAIENYWGIDIDEHKEKYPDLYKKYMSLADKDGNVYVYTMNDDCIDFVSPVTHKLYSMQSDNKIYTIPANIYNYYMA